MNPILLVKASICVICLVLAFYFGSTYQESKWQKRELAIHEKEQEVIQRGDDIALEYEKLKESKNAQTNELTKQIYKEIQSNNGYSCVIPARGVQLLAESIKSANNASQSP